MAGHLYEQYERLYLQQAELCEENAVAGVRAAFADISRRYLQTLRSVAMPRQPVLQVTEPTSGNLSSSNHQRLIDAQEKIDAARDSATRQLASAIVNGFAKTFGAFSNLSAPALASSVNQPAVSGTSNHVNVDQEAYDTDDTSMSIKSEDTSECEFDFESLHFEEIDIKEEEDQTEAATTSDNSDDDSNIDNVSVKSESESECESFDSESSSDDEEFTSGQINEENDNASAFDQLMAHSEEQVNIDTQMVDFVSLPSTSTGRSRRRRHRSTRAKKNNANFTVTLIEDSFARKRVNSIRKNKPVPVESENSESSDDEEFVGQPSTTKRKVSSSVTAAKKAKHSHLVQQSTVAAAAGTSQPEEPLKVIVKSLNCPQDGCTKMCKDKTSLDDHLLAKHAIEKYRCLVADCTASFEHHFQLADHRLGHGNPSNWPCGKCSHSFTGYSELYRHHYILHEEGLFECSVDDCDFKETTRSKVYNHQSCHRTPKHICSVDYCGRSFVKKSNLNQHIRVHTQERPYACGQCGQSFNQQNNLTVHLLTHSGTMKVRCIWPECTYQAIKSSNVVQHIRGVHFKLPQSKTKQLQLGIVDDRDAREFLEKM